MKINLIILFFIKNLFFLLISVFFIYNILKILLFLLFPHQLLLGTNIPNLFP